MVHKKRNNPIVRESHYFSKVTDNIVKTMRALYKVDPIKYSFNKQSKIFEINRRTCSSIINKKTWKHIQ